MEELLDAHDAITEAIAAIDERQMDDKVRERIDALLKTNGRTPGELAAARRLAKRQERKIVVP